jgi:hypothetical protein
MSLALFAIQLDIAGQAVSQQVPGAANLTTADAGFGKLMGSLLSFIMAIAAILLLVYLLWAGIDWITSGGDKGKLETARNKITNGIIGIIVLAASTGLITLVQSFLGLCFLKIGGKC